MAKRFFGFFKSQAQNVGTQVTFLDPDKIAQCLERFSDNNKLLNDLYSVFISMLKSGKSRLNITEEMLDRLGEESSKFDDIIDRMDEQIKHDEEDVKMKRYRLLQIKKENENLKHTIEMFKKDTDWHTWKEGEFEQLKMIKIAKIEELRQERFELEQKLNELNNQIEGMVEKLHETGEQVDHIQILRDNQAQDHRENKQVMIRFWSETKSRRLQLLSIGSSEDIIERLRPLFKSPADLLHLEEDIGDLKLKQNILDLHIQDELEQQMDTKSRNHELLSKVIQNEEIVFTLKATLDGMSKAVIAARWHDHTSKRPRDWYKSLPTSEQYQPAKILAIN